MKWCIYYTRAAGTFLQSGVGHICSCKCYFSCHFMLSNVSSIPFFLACMNLSWPFLAVYVGEGTCCLTLYVLILVNIRNSVFSQQSLSKVRVHVTSWKTEVKVKKKSNKLTCPPVLALESYGIRTWIVTRTNIQTCQSKTDPYLV